MTNAQNDSRIFQLRERVNGSSGRVPDFFIVGAPKSGTSSLYNYLIQHQSIFMTDPKEPHFFYNHSSPGSPVLGVKDLNKYLTLFEGVPERMRAGEASTSYLWLANAAREIHVLQPQARIIALLRNPVERAYSHYWHTMRYGKKCPTFEEALEEESERISRGLWHGLYYTDCGRYANQIQRYLNVFGREAVRVYLFEDLISDPQGICHDVFEFLGVDPGIEIKAQRVYNAGGAPRSRLYGKLLRTRTIKELLKKVLPENFRRNLGDRFRASNKKPIPKMSPETESRLRETFYADILHLEELLGRDLRSFANW